MKKPIFISLITFILFSCKQTNYRYKIDGKVYISDSNCMYDGIWFTNTIDFDKDTIYYFNSDGSEVRIYPPYKIKDRYIYY